MLDFLNFRTVMCNILFSLICFSCASNFVVHNVHDDPPATSSQPGTAIAGAPNTVTILPKTLKNGVKTETISPEELQKKKAQQLAELSPLTSQELQKYAYELGLDPKKELTLDQKIQIDQRKKLRALEKALDSQKERQQYSKVLPWLKSDEEKLEFLGIPSIEGRQVWINKNRIWSRAKNLKDFTEVMEGQDIAMGMPADYVKKSWGEPDNVEASGNPIYKNERWKYVKQVSTPQGYRQEKRYVYFEGGRVVGWETE